MRNASCSLLAPFARRVEQAVGSDFNNNIIGFRTNAAYFDDLLIGKAKEICRELSKKPVLPEFMEKIFHFMGCLADFQNLRDALDYQTPHSTDRVSDDERIIELGKTVPALLEALKDMTRIEGPVPNGRVHLWANQELKRMERSLAILIAEPVERPAIPTPLTTVVGGLGFGGT